MNQPFVCSNKCVGIGILCRSTRMLSWVLPGHMMRALQGKLTSQFVLLTTVFQRQIEFDILQCIANFLWWVKQPESWLDGMSSVWLTLFHVIAFRSVGLASWTEAMGTHWVSSMPPPEIALVCTACCTSRRDRYRFSRQFVPVIGSIHPNNFF